MTYSELYVRRLRERDEESRGELFADFTRQRSRARGAEGAMRVALAHLAAGRTLDAVHGIESWLQSSEEENRPDTEGEDAHD
jgi:hypothetical protein